MARTITNPSKAAPERWVLAGTYTSGPAAGLPQYHRCDTVIGPASTPDLDKAEVFPTREAAMASGGFTHWSSFLEPKLLEAASVRKVA